MLIRRGKESNCRRPGVAAAELAILLPFVCFLFVIAIDFSRIFYFSLTVTNCARNGAVYGCANPIAAVDQPGISAAASKDAGNLDSANLTVRSTTNSSMNPTSLTVTVSYPFTTIRSEERRVGKECRL